MPENLVLITSSIVLFLIEIFLVYILFLLYEKPCNVFYPYLMSMCLLRQKCLSLHRKTSLLHVLKSELLCEME